VEGNESRMSADSLEASCLSNPVDVSSVKPVPSPLVMSPTCVTCRIFP